jgi:DNA invertase Pin-like site-specific DNA recombinase
MENINQAVEQLVKTRIKSESRSKAQKEAIAKAKAAGTYRGGKPKLCQTCGYSHKQEKPCKEPKNEKALAKLAKNSGSMPQVGSQAAGTPVSSV